MRIMQMKRTTIFSWRMVLFPLAGAILILSTFFIYTKTAYGLGVFGGRIVNVTYCPIEHTFAIEVEGPLSIGGGTFTYLPTTILYSFYQIYRPGAWVLGTEVPGSTCRGKFKGKIRDILTPDGYMVMVGTSL
ncbi:MAG: hypothetical protein ACYCZ7_02550 [Minisyncoccota bacterium]